MIKLTPLFKQSYPDVACFSTTRQGGCSEGNYASFNCNHYCGDNPKHVAKNRELLCAELSIAPEQLVIPHQVHGTEILKVDDAFCALPEAMKQEKLEGVDALIAQMKGECLCISTADCIPVMLYDAKKQAIAAVHAGWRGSVKCIASKAIAKMKDAFGTDAADLAVAIGPGISFEAFEVGQDVYDEFEAAGFPMPFIARRLPSMKKDEAEQGIEKWHIDLWQANRLQLLAQGVPPEHIHIEGTCTYMHPDTYFSARRLGIASGRILSGIMLKK